MSHVDKALPGRGNTGDPEENCSPLLFQPVSSYQKDLLGLEGAGKKAATARYLGTTLGWRKESRIHLGKAPDHVYYLRKAQD